MRHRHSSIPNLTLHIGHNSLKHSIGNIKRLTAAAAKLPSQRLLIIRRHRKIEPRTCVIHTTILTPARAQNNYGAP